MVYLTKKLRHRFIGIQGMKTFCIMDALKDFVSSRPVKTLENGNQVFVIVNDQITFRAVIRVEGSQYTVLLYSRCHFAALRRITASMSACVTLGFDW